MTQAQVAERMGTQPPAVACLERALATGKHSPSPATLRKYAEACGRKLVLKLAKPLNPATGQVWNFTNGSRLAKKKILAEGYDKDNPGWTDDALGVSSIQ